MPLSKCESPGSRGIIWAVRELFEGITWPAPGLVGCFFLMSVIFLVVGVVFGCLGLFGHVLLRFEF